MKIFSGVVITDDLDMKAVADNYSQEQTIIGAVNAGCDILLVCRRPEKVFENIEIVKKAIAEGKIDEQRINESVYRIISLKERYLGNNMTLKWKIEKFNLEVKGN